MLKKIRGLFLGLMVLAGSACVTPTHASSAQTVIMTYVQPAGLSGAKEELVVLYNSSIEAVDLTDTCLVNKSNVAFACFSSNVTEGKDTTYIVPSYGYLTVASEEYVTAHNYVRDFYSLIYSVTNQSSGSMVGSADSISLVDTQREKVRTKSWTSSLASGKAWVRTKLITMPDIYAINNESTDWIAESIVEPPQSSLVVTAIPLNSQPGGDSGGGGSTGGSDGTNNGGGSAVGAPGSENLPTPLLPIITELLANPAGSDADGEYIELYNPNASNTVSLDGMKLRVGFDSPKWYSFPEHTTIAPQSYVTFSNSELGFTLVNAAGRVQLFRDTVAAGEFVEYASPKDDQAWALIDGVWRYTAQPTPATANVLALQSEAPDNIETVEAASAQKPCASNQYRNPETGRCKLISSAAAASSPTSCKEGQERSPETNRCRAVAGAATSTSCKEGQERNPETNRCRAIVKMTDVNYKVQGVQNAADDQPRWYYWLAIVIVVSLVAGYAVWEWREELRSVWNRLRNYLRGLVRK